MAHFYDIIYKREVDVAVEEEKINYLLSIEGHNYGGYSSSLADFIDDYYFRDLKISANYIDLKPFLSDSKQGAKSTTEGFIFYCETILTLLDQLSCALPYYHNQAIDSTIATIIKIINYDLDKMNLTRESINKEEFGKVIIIIPKDELLESVLSNSKNQDVKEYLIEYKSSHNDGNVKAKEEILKLLATHVEGITKQKKYYDLNKRLFDDADFLFNNLNIRHNQEVKDIRFYNSTSKNREEWLDLAYRETLLVLNSVVEFEDTHKIKEKKKLTGL